MKYKLINKKTSEEHLCDKVVVDEFDYYYIDELIPYNPNGGTNGNFVCLGEIISNKEHNVKLGDKKYISPFVKNVGSCGGCRKIVATNNPNKDLPKVVDEVEKLAFKNGNKIIQTHKEQDIKTEIWISGARNIGFKEGYNKYQETCPNSDEDIVEFFDWCNFPIYRGNGEFGFRTRVVAQFPEYNTHTIIDQNGNNCLPKGKFLTTKELLQFWKDQKITTLYYE